MNTGRDTLSRRVGSNACGRRPWFLVAQRQLAKGVSGGWSAVNSIVSPSLDVTSSLTEPDTIARTRSPGSPSWKISWCFP
jgi:hypothetical protein